MSKTKTQLITETLSQLGALGVGETPSAEDSDAVDARIGPLVEDLAARNVIYVADTDDIPDSVFNYFVLRLAEECAVKFGKQMDATAIQFAEGRMRVLSRIGSGRRRALAVDCAIASQRRPFRTW